MRRYLELAPSNLHPAALLQFFLSGESRERGCGLRRLDLPGFPTRVMILLDKFLSLHRLPPRSSIPGSSQRGRDHSSQRISGGFSALARDEIPQLERSRRSINCCLCSELRFQKSSASAIDRGSQ